MLLITAPGWAVNRGLNRQTASQSRANGDGHNSVPNKDRADFPPMWESDHTIAPTLTGRAIGLSSSGGGQFDWQPAGKGTVRGAYSRRPQRWEWQVTANGEMIANGIEDGQVEAKFEGYNAMFLL